jgi:hypothetical protein
MPSLSKAAPSLLEAFQNSLPLSDAWMDVPDSVKYFSWCALADTTDRIVLHFEPESALERFHLYDWILRRFRSRPELHSLYTEHQIA